MLKRIFTLLGLSLFVASPLVAEEVTSMKVTNPKVHVCLQPLGKYKKSLLQASSRGITYLFGFHVRVLPAQKMPKFAYTKARRRWRADKLLDHLNQSEFLKRGECTMILGFTKEDISTTVEEHKDWGVLGLAEVGGKVGVVSSYRTRKKLKPPHTSTRRTVKVMNHELGHILGIPHIKGEGCLMNDAEGSVLSTDLEHGFLCASTIAWLERMHSWKVPRHVGEFDWKLVAKER